MQLYDPFNIFKPMKRLTVAACGLGSAAQLFYLNNLRVEGREHLANLPHQNVLFTLNHQTYFMDMIAFYWVIAPPIPFKNYPWVYFVADGKTMQKNFITRVVFGYAGCLPVQRTWKDGEAHVKRQLDTSSQDRIHKALNDGWVVTFPQGTTEPYAPVRHGTGHIIQGARPLVVPVVIDGFNQAFSKNGLKVRKTGIDLSIRIKAPLELNYDENVQELCDLVADGIEQSEHHRTRTTKSTKRTAGMRPRTKSVSVA